MGDADVLMSASEEPTQDDPEDAVMEDALVENVETSARPTSASNTVCPSLKISKVRSSLGLVPSLMGRHILTLHRL